jgi:HEAT repeat protein
VTTKRGKRPSFEEELATLSSVGADPRSDDARQRLLDGLRSKRSFVAARAARLIKEHHLEGFDDELTALFDRCMPDAVKNDPSCAAKVAAIEALDYGESGDAEPFLRAAAHVQLEGSSDTAAPMRARAVLALARIGHGDFDLVAAQLLTDKTPPVRQAALDALVHRGDRANAALALFKLRIGDEDPLVTLAAMAALLALAPARGIEELRDLVESQDEDKRELAAVALGQSRRDEALTVLLSALERCARSDERVALLRGAGLHRSERALVALLAVIADSHEADARAAIEALGPRRFEPGIADRVRAAAASNDRADLRSFVDAVFAAA